MILHKRCTVERNHTLVLNCPDWTFGYEVASDVQKLLCSVILYIQYKVISEMFSFVLFCFCTPVLYPKIFLYVYRSISFD